MCLITMASAHNSSKNMESLSAKLEGQQALRYVVGRASAVMLLA